MRRIRAAVNIQKNVRRWLQRRKYVQILSSIVNIQTYGRALLARRKYKNMKQHKAVMFSNVKRVRFYARILFFNDSLLSVTRLLLSNRRCVAG